MKFTKMHGIGNDYIYVDGAREKVINKPLASIKLSDRHFGIGSDGMIFINPSKVADFEMEMYNADGSRAEMCGNGIRCVAKYVYDKGLTDKKEFTIETLAGIKIISLKVDEKTNKAVLATVNMGKPILKAELVPADVSFFIKDEKEEPYDSKSVEYDSLDAIVSRKLAVCGKEYTVTCVSMGNPHAIVFIDSAVKDFPLEDIGPLFEKHEAFPRRTNTEFAKVIDRNTIEMRVWERGSGETLACGTGACATAVAAMLNGLVDDTVTIKLIGGDLHISWDKNPESPVFMEGSATIAFEGEVSLADFDVE